MELGLPIINDSEKIREVHDKTKVYLDQQEELRKGIAKHLEAYNEILNLFPQTIDKFWSGHIFPFVESEYELESSLQLSVRGFYRHALYSLRCVLELGTLSVYYDRNDQAEVDIQKWLRSVEPSPYLSRQVLPKLFELEYLKIYDQRFHLQQFIRSLYSELSDYAHVRGYFYSSRAQAKVNFNQFNEESLRVYVGNMRLVVKTIITLILLKFPIGMQELPLDSKFGLNGPAGGFLDEDSYPKVMCILDEKSRVFMKRLSDADPNVQKVVAYINSLSDLTPEEWEQQIRESEKEMRQISEGQGSKSTNVNDNDKS